MIRWIDLLLRAVLAALFLLAGAMKLRDTGAFAGEIENYRLLSPQFSLAAAYLVPWLEIFGAIALFSKPLRLGGWSICVILCAGFTFFVGSAWMRGLDISCGCFGSSSSAIGPGTVSRASAMLLVASAGFWREFSRQVRTTRG